MALSNILTNGAVRKFGVYEGRLAAQLGLEGESLVSHIYNEVGPTVKSGKLGAKGLQGYIDNIFRPTESTIARNQAFSQAERVSPSMTPKASPAAAGYHDAQMASARAEADKWAVNKSVSANSGLGDIIPDVKTRPAMSTGDLKGFNPEVSPAYKYSPKGGWSDARYLGDSAMGGIIDQSPGANKLFMPGVGRSMVQHAAFPMAGALAGGFTGFVGNQLYPNQVEYGGTLGGVAKGAAFGFAMGAFKHGMPKFTEAMNVLNDAGKYSMLKAPTNFAQSIANSKVAMGALGAAATAGTFMNGIETNLTRPLNGVQSV